MPISNIFKPYSGVGVVSLHPRSATGVALSGYDLGESPSFKLGHKMPALEMKTSRDTTRGPAYRMAQSFAGTVEMKLSTMSEAVLAVLLSGTWTETPAAAAFTNVSITETVSEGMVTPLSAGNLSAFSLQDSTPTPAKIPVNGVNYTVDLFSGTITWLNLTIGGPFIQPFKWSGTPGAIKTLGAAKAATTEYWLKFSGTDAYSGERNLVDAFRVQFGEEGDQEFIQEGYAEWTLKGTLLRDTTKLAASAGGQYYGIRRL